MIYKILKHSLPCLPTCQECAAARILGVVGLLWVPLQSLPPALPWQQRTPESLSVLRECHSPFIHSKLQVDFIHGEMVQLYISSLQGSDISKNVGMKKSVRTSPGGGWRVNRLILRGFYSHPNLRERYCGAKFSPPPTSVFPFPCRPPVPWCGNHRDTWSGLRLCLTCTESPGGLLETQVSGVQRVWIR